MNNLDVDNINVIRSLIKNDYGFDLPLTISDIKEFSKFMMETEHKYKIGENQPKEDIGIVRRHRATLTYSISGREKCIKWLQDKQNEYSNRHIQNADG